MDEKQIIEKLIQMEKRSRSTVQRIVFSYIL